MKRFYSAIFNVFIFMAVLWPSNVFALDVFGAYTVGDTQVIEEDIYIDSMATISNYGKITGTIHVADGATAVFENYGELSSNFDCGTDVMLEQKITASNSVRPITNIPEHSISVENAYAVNLADLVNLSGTTTQIKLTDSMVTINGDLQQVVIPIIVNGNAVSMSVRGVSESWLTNSEPVITTIIGAAPFVQVVGIDPMYTLEPRFGADGALYLDLARQTDYSEVLPDGGLGEFLDMLHETEPENPLVTHLDSASSMDEIVHIRNKSAQTNPIKLMKPIKTLHSLIMPLMLPKYDSVAIDIMPLYVYSNDFYYYGGAVRLGGKLFDNWVGRIGLGLGHLNFENSLDDYSGTVYSGDFELVYSQPDFYLRTAGVVSYSNFHNINVFNRNKLVREPNGVAETFVFDAGTNFHLFDVLNVAPFLGMRFDSVYLHGNQNSWFPIRVGADVAHHTIMDQNDYTVGAHMYAQTDNVFYIEFYTNVMSTADSVGGGFSVGVLHDDMGTSYRASANAKILF